MKYAIFIEIFVLTFILMVSAIFTAMIFGFGYNMAKLSNITNLSPLRTNENLVITILAILTGALVIFTYLYLAFSVRRKM